MLLLSCSNDTNPCPVIFQVWVESASISNPADVGITPETIAYVASWGFGVVFLGFLLGYALGIAIGIIKKL